MLTLKKAIGRISAIICALAALALGIGGRTIASAAEPIDPKEIYVSPTGNDAFQGTYGAPVRTLAVAQQRARNARLQDRQIIVRLSAGTYYLSQPLVFTPEDSRIDWEAEKGAEVVISGGLKLDLSWKPYKNGIFQAETPNGVALDQLFVNGVPQVLARYPNHDPQARVFGGVAADCVSPARAARWQNPTGGVLHAMHAHEWGSMCWQITGKDANNNVQLEGGWQTNRPSPPHAKLRFVENILEELDAPGEWFHDAKNRTLYFFPPAGLDLAKAICITPQLTNIIEFRGRPGQKTKSVTLSGVTLRHSRRTTMETKEPLLRTDWCVYRAGAVFFDNAEYCGLFNCTIDQAGGNGIFVNSFVRDLRIIGCRIDQAGASGILFVGSPTCARNPLFNYNQSNHLKTLDMTPGPVCQGFPASCLVEDCLISKPGRVEKQGTGIGIDLAARITVRHCTIYDTPRAGINIGDGCWGGHVIEFCDVFNTVLETGDHGAFNSWGRDRFWHLGGSDSNKIGQPFDADKMDLPRLDVVEPITLRNNRWRCDHGWDIDLDDGSTNYRIVNNLCLSGGIKNREGFHRIVENNIIVNNSFHPHVWYENSQDVFRRNIVMSNYQPIQMPKTWGKEVDYNLLHNPALDAPRPWSGKDGQDAHSQTANAQFENPAAGDYRLKEGSPALALGFRPFAMSGFGVQRPELKRRAKAIPFGKAQETRLIRDDSPRPWQGVTIRNITGLGEMTVFGTPGETGVRVIDIPSDHPLAKAGLQKDDVIVGASGTDVVEVGDLVRQGAVAANRPVTELRVLRKQQPVIVKAP